MPKTLDIINAFDSSTCNIHYAVTENTYGNIRLSLLVAIRCDDIGEIRSILAACNCHQIKIIEKKCYTFMFFRYGSNNDLGISVSPKGIIKSADQGAFNLWANTHVAYEFRAMRTKEGCHIPELDGPSFRMLSQLLDSLLVDTLEIESSECEQMRFLNTHLELTRHYLNLTDRKCPAEHNTDFSHFSFFSKVYYWEIRVMADVFAEGRNAGTGFTVHDFGTCLAQLPLLLSSLSPEDMFGLRISQVIASDARIIREELIHTCLRRYSKPKPIKLMTIQLNNTIGYLPNVDVSILTDVLEHLPDEETVRSVLLHIWKHTRKLLIVHVPFEERPSRVWGHKMAFSSARLSSLAQSITDREILSERYENNDGKRLTEDGFLILRKV